MLSEGRSYLTAFDGEEEGYFEGIKVVNLLSERTVEMGVNCEKVGTDGLATVKTGSGMVGT